LFLEEFMSRLAILLVLILLTFSSSAMAQTPSAPPLTYIKGEVLDVAPIQESTQKTFLTGQGDVVTLRLTTGPEKGKIVDTFNYFSGRSMYEFKVNRGDKVIIAVSNDLGRTTYHVSDFDRFDYTWWLFGLFALALIVFGGFIGLKSVLVIAFSVFLILNVFLNRVLAHDVSLTVLTLLTSAIIAGLTQTVISGWNTKSFAAILGTIGGVIIAGVLSIASIHLMNLTGLDSEEAMMLKATVLKAVDFRGLLFSGMVLGSLGAVLDVTISISSAIYEVKQAQPDIGVKQLFAAGMNVGRDIMGTNSNTLILAYIGSSLPLLLLIAAQPQSSMLPILNQNMIVTEIARALSGSIGVVCAIPLTAMISAWLMRTK
jgi:uncharacterized membrane protein